MKRITLLLIVVVMLFSIAASPVIRLVRLTVINRSGYELGISLLENAETPLYYLRSDVGDREKPVTTVWTILQGVYSAEIFLMRDGAVESSYVVDLPFGGPTKLVVLPPEKPGEALCNEAYEDDKPALAECLESLQYLKYGSDNVQKFLPSKWVYYRP